MIKYRIRELGWWHNERIWIVVAGSFDEAAELVKKHEGYKGHDLAYSILEYKAKREKEPRIVKFISNYD